MGLAEGRRGGGPDHGIAHFVGDGVQPAPDDLGRDRIHILHRYVPSRGFGDPSPRRSSNVLPCRYAVPLSTVISY